MASIPLLKGPKLKESAPDAAPAPEEPWTTPKFNMGKPGYPAFPAGHGGLVGTSSHHRWTGVNLSMQVRAVRDQPGLQLISKRGPGDIVVVGHVEKAPIEN